MTSKHLVVNYEFYDETSDDMVECKVRLPFPFDKEPDEIEFSWDVEELDS